MNEAKGREDRFLDFVNRIDSPERLAETFEHVFGALARRQDAAGQDSSLLSHVLVAARKKLPERKYRDVESAIEALQEVIDELEGASLHEDISNSLANTAWTTLPVLLLPLRLETRFHIEHEHGARNPQLLLRVFPDDVHLNTHHAGLTRNEVEEGKAFWGACREAEANGGETTLRKKAAWRVLSRSIGPERAAWVARKTRTLDFEADSEVSEAPAEPEATPVAEGLPDRFCAFVHAKGKPVRKHLFRPLPRKLSLLDVPETGPQDLVGGTPSWMADFGDAIEQGLAARIDIDPDDLENGLKKVVVVGLQNSKGTEAASQVEALIDAHRYTEGLAFVSPGTPTRNAPDKVAGYTSRDDHETAFDAVVENGPEDSQSPPSDADRLARALGIDARPLVGIHGAADTQGSFAGKMNRLVWSATGDSYLRVLFDNMFLDFSWQGRPHVSEERLQHVSAHFEKFVRGNGPLPSLRIGRHPYGILPVTRIQPVDEDTDGEGWAPRPLSDHGGWHEHGPVKPWPNRQKGYDRSLHRTVFGFFKEWLQYASDPARVPRIQPNDSDPDKTLLEILAMEPKGVAYRARPFVDEQFIAWLLARLRHYAFGANTAYAHLEKSPVEWMKEWENEWIQVRREAADFLASITRADSGTLSRAKMLRLFAWREGADITRKLSRDPEHPDLEPRDQLGDQISEDPPAREALSLLAQLAKLAVKSQAGKEAVGQLAAEPTSGQAPDLDELLRDSLDLLSHRVDAWVTSFASKRLTELRREEASGLHLGAYGFVEDLHPRARTVSEGYFHAPSSGQAAASAVLFNAYLTHEAEGEANPFRVNLTSGRVRRAQRIIEGVRQGQPLGALLGYQFERDLKDQADVLALARHIDSFRDRFPLVADKIPEHRTGRGSSNRAHLVAARNVVDGLALVRDWRIVGTGPDSASIWPLRYLDVDVAELPSEERSAIETSLRALDATLDAVSDVLMSEGVYQAVQGNYERAGAALDASNGASIPPEPDFVETPAAGQSFTNRVGIVFHRYQKIDPDRDPRGAAEPRLAAWLADMLGPMEHIGVAFSYQQDGGEKNEAVHLGESGLDLSATDLLYLADADPEDEHSEVARRLAIFFRLQRKLPGDQDIEVHADRSGSHAYSLSDALELARQADRLASSADRAMGPADVTHSGAGVSGALGNDGANAPPSTHEAFSKADVERFAERVARVQKAADRLSEDLGQGTIDSSVSLLLRAANFGIGWAVPSTEQLATLEQHVARVRTELDRRREASRRSSEQARTEIESSERATSDPADQAEAGFGRPVRRLLEAMKALFGEGFVALPTFVPPAAGSMIDPGETPWDILNGQGEERLRLWLRQVAEVRQPIAELEDVVLMSTAWSTDGTSPLDLHVHQLPVTPGRFWLGLSEAERSGEAIDESWPLNPLSLVLATNGTLPDGSSDQEPVPVAGLVLDEWIERIPDKTADTSVAFQYDGPTAQAPNALLLAVPAQMKDEPWTVEALARIVEDTIDLMKVRAVDIDALSTSGGTVSADDGGLASTPVGAFLPGIYLPIEPDRAAAGQEPLNNTISDWIHELEELRPACVKGTLISPQGTTSRAGRTIHLAGTEATSEPQPLLESSEFPWRDYAQGLDSPDLEGATIEARGYEGEASGRVFVRDYSVINYPKGDSFSRLNLPGRFVLRDGDVRFQYSAPGLPLRVFGAQRHEARKIAAVPGDGVRVRVRGHHKRGSDRLWIDSIEALKGHIGVPIPRPGLWAFRYENGAEVGLHVSPRFGHYASSRPGKYFVYASGEDPLDVPPGFGTFYLLRESDATIDCRQ